MSLSTVARFAAFACVALMAVRSAVAAENRYESPVRDEFLKSWLVAGPFAVAPDGTETVEETAQRAAFDRDFLADGGGEAGIVPTPETKHTVDGATVAWKVAAASGDSVDLLETVAKRDFAVAYAYAEVVSDKDAALVAGLGSDDGVKLWVNGEKVHERWVGRALVPDDDIFVVRLKSGVNRLLLKVQNQRLDWGFAFRFLGGQSVAAVVRRGDAETLTALLESGVDANRKDESGLTPLHVAQLSGRKDLSDSLLARGADPNVAMPALSEYLDGLCGEWFKGDVPGVSILVARDGKVLFEKGYGFASLEHRAPMTVETKSRIGSVTKQFIASAILRLHEEGGLSVDDPISTFFPDFPRGDEVSVHHLLTHTSGIHSVTSNANYVEQIAAPVESADLLRTIAGYEYDFEPGTKWLYNNSGYILLGLIVEKVTGKSYGDYLKETFFEPLGMANTGVHTWDAILPNEASGYMFRGARLGKSPVWDMSRAGGAGSLYSTVGDLYRWNEALFSGKVLKPETRELAFTVVSLPDGSKPAMNYGYGWVIDRYRGLREVEHSGGLPGFAAYLSRFPDQNLTVAVLENALPGGKAGSDPSSLAHRIADYLLWREMSPTEPPSEPVAMSSDALEAYTGWYDILGARIAVAREGDGLALDLPGQRVVVQPKGNHVFATPDGAFRATFLVNDQGEANQFSAEAGGRQLFTATRTKVEQEISVPAEVLRAYVGKYDYGQGAILTVTLDGNHLYAQMTGQPRFEIYPRTETVFFWKVTDAEVEFVKDESGKVVRAHHKQNAAEINAPKVE